MKVDPLPAGLGLSGADAPAAAVSALGRAQQGAVEAFAALIRAHQSAVYTLALRLLGSREEAQELAQDVFLQLHASLARIESETHLRFWLRRTVSHRAIDRLRRRRERRAPAVPEELAAAQGGDPLLERRLRELVAGLPATARAVLLLRYQEDLDPTDIALALELPLNTVKSHLKRSLALLRRRCELDGLE